MCWGVRRSDPLPFATVGVCCGIPGTPYIELYEYIGVFAVARSTDFVPSSKADFNLHFFVLCSLFLPYRGTIVLVHKIYQHICCLAASRKRVVTWKAPCFLLGVRCFGIHVAFIPGWMVLCLLAALTCRYALPSETPDMQHGSRRKRRSPRGTQPA